VRQEGQARLQKQNYRDEKEDWKTGRQGEKKFLEDKEDEGDKVDN
jgi:hypothetical protein